MNDVTIDNPQGTITAKEVGWIAGIIDGEGTIVLFIMEKAGRLNGVSPQVIMANTDKALVEKYYDILRRAGIGAYCSTYIGKHRPTSAVKKRHDAKYKDLYRVSVTGYIKTKRLLDLVIDELIGDKQERAKRLLKLINYRLSRQTAKDKTVIGKTAPYNLQDLLLIKDVCLLMKSKHEHLVDGLLRDHEQKRQEMAA